MKKLWMILAVLGACSTYVEPAADCPDLPVDGSPMCMSCEASVGLLSTTGGPHLVWCPDLGSHDMCPQGTEPKVCALYQDEREQGCLYVDNGYNTQVWCCAEGAAQVSCETDADCSGVVGADPCWTGKCFTFGSVKQCGLAPMPEGAACGQGGQCTPVSSGPWSMVCL